MGKCQRKLNYGVGIAFHDVMANDVNNENDILKHYEIAQNIILEKLSGRGCKMLAEPNGTRLMLMLHYHISNTNDDRTDTRH